MNNVTVKIIIMSIYEFRLLRGDFDSFIARLGDQNIKSKNDKVNELDVPVDEIINHERYDKITKQNDIALVKLKTLVRFSNFIRPACLHQNRDIGENKALATGWGHTGNSDDSASSDELLKVQLDIFDINKCVRYFRDSGNRAETSIVINQNEICAGVLSGGRDTCRGGILYFIFIKKNRTYNFYCYLRLRRSFTNYLA